VFSLPVEERRYKEMSVCMSVCLYLSGCLSVCIAVSLYLYLCLSFAGVLCTRGRTSLQGDVILSVCLCLYVCMSVCLYLSISLSVQVFSVPVEERRYKEMAEQQFGDRGREQAKTCADIMAKTGLLLVVHDNDNDNNNSSDQQGQG